jgi:hypothetical protein
LLFVAVGDSAFGQVVWGKFHCHPVTRKHADSVAAQSAREVGQNGPFLVELDAELAAGEFFNNSSGYFDAVFFAHCPPLSRFVDDSKLL